jgi:hypothetical protein
MIYILIPSFHDPARLNRCLKALTEKTGPAPDWKALINFETNPHGFTKTANRLLKTAMDDPDTTGVVIMNDDTEMQTQFWLAKMMDYTIANPAGGSRTLAAYP